MRIRPSPYGQMPEMTRNQRRFSRAEGPASSALSPCGQGEVLDRDDVGSVGQGDAEMLERDRLRTRRLGRPRRPSGPSILACSIASSNEFSRSTTDLNPSERVVIIDEEGERHLPTRANAPAVCVLRRA